MDLLLFQGVAIFINLAEWWKMTAIQQLKDCCWWKRKIIIIIQTRQNGGIETEVSI